MDELAALRREVSAKAIKSRVAEFKKIFDVQADCAPAELDRAFCEATGDNTLLSCRAELAGYKMINAIDAELLELGREYLKQKRANEKVAALEMRLRGVENL